MNDNDMFHPISCAVVYSFDGIVVFGLLVICTCAYMCRVPRLKQWLLSEKKGFLGIFYKGLFVATCIEYELELENVITNY